jgi:2-hydroxychromene-2-carboxylate isomerase
VRVIHYFDYKSPYAFLAQEATFALSERPGVEVEWRPLTLDIPQYLGTAKVADDGSVIEASRNAHQWRRVKYSYMDCRREANRRGLTILGPRKIFDSSLAHIGFLFAAREGDFRPYHDAVYQRFWKRELDIEDPAVISQALEASGIDARGFGDFLHGEGRQLHDENQTDAEAHGVFGVPSYLVAGELFWGLERLERVEEIVSSR